MSPFSKEVLEAERNLSNLPRSSQVVRGVAGLSLALSDS